MRPEVRSFNVKIFFLLLLFCGCFIFYPQRSILKEKKNLLTGKWKGTYKGNVIELEFLKNSSLIVKQSINTDYYFFKWHLKDEKTLVVSCINPNYYETFHAIVKLDPENLSLQPLEKKLANEGIDLLDEINYFKIK
ncbi:MAG: hypothetical protein PHD97_08830 [Bacteroidales bacterium]|nr:hypothetical protein [Bacteroidales bacterium]